MIKLDNNFLIELGLGSLPPAEKNKMLNHIYETLEGRVGMHLAERMSEQQLTDFEGYIKRQDQQGALQWLESNFPDYRQVVSNELDKLKGEIQQVAPKIVAQSQQAQAQQIQPQPEMPQQPAPQTTVDSMATQPQTPQPASAPVGQPSMQSTPQQQWGSAAQDQPQMQQSTQQTDFGGGFTQPTQNPISQQTFGDPASLTPTPTQPQQLQSQPLSGDDVSQQLPTSAHAFGYGSGSSVQQTLVSPLSPSMQGPQPSVPTTPAQQQATQDPQQSPSDQLFAASNAQDNSPQAQQPQGDYFVQQDQEPTSSSHQDPMQPPSAPPKWQPPTN